jgi:hypothetical protein
VDHPQYGKVEVGGFKKNWVRQPPSFLLEEECHRNMAFTLLHAHEMPRVKIQSVQVTPREGGLHEITAIVENTRAIPTHSRADVARKITPADTVSLSGEDLQVIVSWQSEEPYFEEAQEQRPRPDPIQLDSIEGNSVVYARWWVTGHGPFRVSLTSVKGGRDEWSGEVPDAPAAPRE